MLIHIAPDSPFVDLAFANCETVAPGQNEVYIISANPMLQYVRTSPVQGILDSRRCLRDLPIRRWGRGDALILHSMTGLGSEIARKANCNVVWVGYGADYYYTLLYNGQSSLLLPETRRFYYRATKQNSVIRPCGTLRSFLGKIKNKFRQTRHRVDLRQLLKHGHVDFFAPVLPAEYDMVRNAVGHGLFPKYVKWSFGELSPALEHACKGAPANGRDILVGNSASWTNNHFDAFSLIRKHVNLESRKVVALLAYGDPTVRNSVISRGYELFGDGFVPITDFVPLEQHLDRLRSCRHAVMNHLRQQGAGTVTLLLALGCKLFMQPANPLFSFELENGKVVYPVTEIVTNPHSMSFCLDDQSIQRNRHRVLAEANREAVLAIVAQFIRTVTA